MDKILNSILERRSIRKYTNQPISQDLIKILMQAAMSAPSACNQQPWHFVIIDEKNILIELSKHNPGYSMLADAPLAILICGEVDSTILKHFWTQDCSAATQNILIAAQTLGLGAVWLGVYPEESKLIYLNNVLNIPKYITPFALVSIGYPAEIKKPEDRYKEAKVHNGKF